MRPKASLSTTEAVIGDWVRCWQQAFDTCPSLSKNGECRDPVDFVRTQQNWLFEAIRKTTLDIRALAGWKLELRTMSAANSIPRAKPWANQVGGKDELFDLL